MKKMVIFTETKVGEGHYQAAKAIEKVIQEHFADRLNIKLYSGMRCVHPWFENCVVSLYFFLIRFLPFMWKWVYTKSRRSTMFQKYVFAYRLTRILKQENPDYVLCTHVSCVPALNEIKRRGTIQFKFIVVFTDFCFHPYFVQDEVDTYFVAHQKIKNRLIQEYNINADMVFDYGIPIRPEFEREDSHERNLLLFKDWRKFHILVLGGATGYGPIEKIITLFHPVITAFPIQITVITGNNQRLFTRLSKIKHSHVQVLGYVQDMRYWISHADLIITKPGGLTISEALACGTPMLLYKPIPGHEEANLKFIEEEELALTVRDLEQIPLIVRSMYYQSEQWDNWKSRLRQHHKPHSALRIVETIASIPLDVHKQKEYT